MVKGHLDFYLDSFRLNKDYWYTWLIDAVTFAVIYVLWYGFGQILIKSAFAISGGQTAEQLKLTLLSASLETSQAFLSSVRWFAFWFFAGTIIIAIITLLLFSYSRGKLWSYLHNTSFSRKRYWRWNLLNLVLAIFVVPYVLFFVMLRIGFSILIPLRNETAAALSTSIFISLVLFAYIFMVFLIYHSFLQQYKVWGSIGEGFRLISTRWASLWRAFLFIVFTGVVVSMFSTAIARTLQYYPQWIGTITSLGIFLLFVSWMRRYVFTVIHHS